MKTSGMLGLHVAVPLEPGHSFDTTKRFARRLAEDLAGDAPGAIVAHSRRSERAGRVYIDWIQNDRNRQLVAPYSLRATPVPMVSLPVAWDEVEAAATSPSTADSLLRGTPARALERVERHGDLWSIPARGRLPD